MIKAQLLFLSVVCLLCSNAFGQFSQFYADLTGDQMVPPVNTQRSTALQVSFSADETGGVAVMYSFLDAKINDKTSLSLYGTPSDHDALLIDIPNPLGVGKAVIPVAGGAENFTLLNTYINSISAVFNLGFGHAIVKTTAFPNGEVRGEFDILEETNTIFYGATLFPFPGSLFVPQTVFIFCVVGVNTGNSTCAWNSALPVGGSVELQGPNGFVLQLTASNFYVNPPFPGLAARGSFTVPAPLTVAQFIDLGNRGELRLSYKIGSTEVGSTALSVAVKPPTLEAKLTGSNVVPPVTTSATGTATMVFEGLQTVSLTHSVSEAKRFTLYSGAAGVNGEELIDYLPGIFPIPNEVRFIGISLLDEQQNAQQYYVTVSSNANPNGEIRGQFSIFPNNEFTDTLSGTKMVPAVTSQLTGQAVLSYDSILKSLYFNISSTSTSTSAVLLRGPADSSSTGPILATLCSFKCNLRRIFFGVLKEDSQGFASGQTLTSVVDLLLQGKAYVELQTTQNPSGELRANLVASINNNPPTRKGGDYASSGRPNIDLITIPAPPGPSVPKFFRRRERAQ